MTLLYLDAMGKIFAEKVCRQKARTIMAEISIQASNMSLIVSCTDAEAKYILQQVIEQFVKGFPRQVNLSDRKTKQVISG